MIDINVGLTANDGTGDPLREAMIIVNANFDELKALIDDTATQEELDAAVLTLTNSINDIYSILDTKSDIGHTHLISEITGLQTTLNGLVTSTTFNSSISSINASIALINDAILDIQLTDDDLQSQIDILNATFSNVNLQFVTNNGSLTTNGLVVKGNSISILDLSEETRAILTQEEFALLDPYTNKSIHIGTDYIEIDRDNTSTSIFRNNEQTQSIDLFLPQNGGTLALESYVDESIDSATASMNLQMVTSIGNTTSNPIIINNGLYNNTYLGIQPGTQYNSFRVTSQDESIDDFGGVSISANPEEGINISKTRGGEYTTINLGTQDITITNGDGVNDNNTTLSPNSTIYTKPIIVTDNVNFTNTIKSNSTLLTSSDENKYASFFDNYSGEDAIDLYSYKSQGGSASYYELQLRNEDGINGFILTSGEGSVDGGDNVLLTADMNSTTNNTIIRNRKENINTNVVNTTSISINNDSMDIISQQDNELVDVNITNQRYTVTQTNGTDTGIMSFDSQDGFILSNNGGFTGASLRADNLLVNQNFQFPDYSGTLTTEEETDVKLQLKQNLPTGFITGLTLSITPGDNTKFDIGAGAYTITDFSDLQNIQVNVYQLPIGLTGLSPLGLTTSIATYIALDENQNVIQQNSPFDNSDRRTLALIGAVIHSNLSTINTTNEIKAPIVAPTNQLHDFMNAIGKLNLNGNEFSANGSNLKLNKSAGQIWSMGINGADFMDPHRLTIGATQAFTFRYRLQNGTEFSDTSDIDPTQYDNGGVLTTLSNNNRWTIQHINMFQSGLVRIQYGQHEYTSFGDAVSKTFTETFNVEQNIADNSIFRAYLITKKTTTDLSADILAGDAAIIQVDKFGNAIGGPGNSLTSSSIISALGYTPENVANKATDFVTINDTLYPTVKAVNDRLLSITTDVWRKSGMTVSATNSTDNIYRSGSANIIGSNKYFSTGPSQTDIDNEILGTNFGHISPGGGTVPFIQLLSNHGNGSSGTNHFIGRFVGAGVNNPQMNFSAIKSTSYDSWGDSGRVLFRFNDGYLSPQTKFDIGTDYIKFNSYPSTRNDIVSGTISNILYTDSVGTLKSTNVNNIFGFTPENVANKATNFGTINDTLYPTVKAVNDRIASTTASLNLQQVTSIGATTSNFTSFNNGLYSKYNPGFGFTHSLNVGNFSNLQLKTIDDFGVNNTIDLVDSSGLPFISPSIDIQSLFGNKVGKVNLNYNTINLQAIDSGIGSTLLLNTSYVYISTTASGGAQLKTNALTSDREFHFPNSSGTFSLTTDLTNYVTLGTTQSITGSKTFTYPIQCNGSIRLEDISAGNYGVFELNDDTLSFYSSPNSSYFGGVYSVFRLGNGIIQISTTATTGHTIVSNSTSGYRQLDLPDASGDILTRMQIEGMI